jgi:hypothetical protein
MAQGKSQRGKDHIFTQEIDQLSKGKKTTQAKHQDDI